MGRGARGGSLRRGAWLGFAGVWTTLWTTCARSVDNLCAGGCIEGAMGVQWGVQWGVQCNGALWWCFACHIVFISHHIALGAMTVPPGGDCSMEFGAARIAARGAVFYFERGAWPAFVV